MSRLNSEVPVTPVTSKECSRYESCSAPLCPLDQGGIWYPTEDICLNRTFSQRQFIQNQRTINAKAKNKDWYFTVAMLDRNIIIRPGIEGCDPDQDLALAARAEARWIEDHPEKKPISDGRRAVLKARMQTMREQKRKIGLSASGRTSKKRAHDRHEKPSV